MASPTVSSSSKPSPPREFPSSGFEVIDPSQLIEEETLPFYKREDYYPVQLGEVLQDRYQVVAKLGYGAGSTVWLSWDLKEHGYWVLKVHVRTREYNHELRIYRYLAGVDMEHPGQEYVRKLQASFKLEGPNGQHDVFVMSPMGMSLGSFQDMQSDRVFEPSLVTTALNQVLLGLNFLHGVNVIHTDLHADNLLISMSDESILYKMEANEIHSPSARKVTDDATIYVSQHMLGGAGPLTICDLGQARIGGENHGKAMPLPYRAPEVILGMPWGNAVDIWGVGVLEFEERNNAYHLAAMTALLGPPPPEFLSRTYETSLYWDEDGQWVCPIPLPTGMTFEALANTLPEEDNKMFLSFLKGVLAWLPEQRLTTKEAYDHPWVRSGRIGAE